MATTQEWISQGRYMLAEHGIEMTPGQFAIEHRMARGRILARLMRLNLPVVECCMDEAATLSVITRAIILKGGA